MTNPDPSRSQLFGLSYDAQASPVLRPSVRDEPGERGARPSVPSAFGVAWYSDDDRAATVQTSADLVQGAPVQDMTSSLFLGRSRAATSSEVGRHAQPFRKGYAGRHFLFAIAGTLAPDVRALFPLEDDFDLAPVSASPEAHVFSWLIAQFRASGARTIGEFGWSPLRDALARINEWGGVSCLLCDGTDLLAYRDAQDQVPMFWARRIPPHESPVLEGGELTIDCNGPMDVARTLFLFGTHPLKGARWTPMEPGELRVARRGVAIWSSHPSDIDERVFSVVSADGISPRVAARKIAERGPAGAQQQHAVASRPAAPRESKETAVLSVVHETVYRYSTPVERSSHRFCLEPVRDARQEVIEHEFELSVPALRRDFEDVFGNRTTVVEISTPFDEMRITSRATVRVQSVSVGDLRSPLRRDQIPLVWMPWQRQMMQTYLLPPELPEGELLELSAFAMSFVERNDYDLVETLLDLNRTIYRDFTYLPSSTTIETTPYQVYEQRRGVCQDFANVMICAARLLGVPARYRVGYIYTGGNYENRIQSDASHAWAELYLPWTGWCGFDPTNGCLTGADHIRVACGRQFRDAAPTAGTIYHGGGGETLSVGVKVDRLDD